MLFIYKFSKCAINLGGALSNGFTSRTLKHEHQCSISHIHGQPSIFNINHKVAVTPQARMQDAISGHIFSFA